MKFVLCVFVVGLMFLPYTAEAIRPFDFGGYATKITPCVNGLWVFVSPPYGGFYFYVPGFSALKLFGPPTHPGQRVLGKSLGVQVCLQPCPIGTCPIGVGFLVQPNAGSSAE